LFDVILNKFGNNTKFLYLHNYISYTTYYSANFLLIIVSFWVNVSTHTDRWKYAWVGGHIGTMLCRNVFVLGCVTDKLFVMGLSL